MNFLQKQVIQYNIDAREYQTQSPNYVLNIAFVQPAREGSI